MKKHKNMKHVVTKCKVCDKIFPNLKDALVHTANDHSQEIVDINSKKNGSEELDVQELHSGKKKKMGNVPGPARGTASHPVCGYIK